MKKKSRVILSRYRKPQDMDIETWQAALRRQFGRDQRFGLENIGQEPVFSEFRVTNREKGSSYRVAIRGLRRGDNFCSCPDLATNALGTCKHIEFVLKKLERQAGRRVLKRGWKPPFSEIHLHYGEQRFLRFVAGSDCPPRVRAMALRLFDEQGKLRPGCEDRMPRLQRVARRCHHVVRHYPDGDAFCAQIMASRSRQQVLRKLCPSGAKSPLLHRLLQAQLLPYQREGALFAATAGRAIIADEMGLGKTIQAIAAMALLKRARLVERVLVICPVSLVDQWKQEILRFAGWESEVVAGTWLARRMQWAQGSAAVRIIGYGAMVRDRAAIEAWSPDLVVVDEAQKIKNWQTHAAQAIKRLTAPLAIVLTGTPLENRLEDLHSIVEFIDPHHLGALFRFLHKHQTTDEHGKVTGYRHLHSIHEHLAALLIRRRRAEVLTQLPSRSEETRFVALLSQQKVIHAESANMVAQIAFRWRRHGHLSEADQRRLTAALQTMRMVCDSVFLCDGVTDIGHKPAAAAKAILELLSESGVKVVVFSTWLRMHHLIARQLEAHRIGFVHFHGGIATRDRPALVQRFHDDAACRVFIAGDVAATGLNLQKAASAVVNVDLPWNPAVLEQRIGRVQRMGQVRPVRVINLVAENSIESRILELLATKRSLAAGILDGGKDTVDLGGDRMKRFMEEVEQAAGVGSASPSPSPSAASTAKHPVRVVVSRGRSTARRALPIAATLRVVRGPSRAAGAAPPAPAPNDIATRLAALVGGDGTDLQVVMRNDGQATVTLSAELLARLTQLTATATAVRASGR